jgi:hypothetical protein
VTTAPAEVQGFQQRREPGDLIGLAAVHAGLPEDRASLLIDDGQQVHGLPAAAGMTGAPHRLAVHGHRPPPAPPAVLSLVSGAQTASEPRSHHRIQRSGVHCFQDPGQHRRHGGQ